MPQETQADREAAKSLEDSLGFLTHDEMPVVIAALATHREQAVKPLVEALEKVMTCMADGDDVFPDKASRDDAIISIVADALAKARGNTK